MSASLSADVSAKVDLELVRSRLRNSAVPLIDWAKLQAPRLSWVQAKALADSGAIATIELPHATKRRLAYYVVIDLDLARRFGIVAAIRAAGWKRRPEPSGGGPVAGP